MHRLRKKENRTMATPSNVRIESPRGRIPQTARQVIKLAIALSFAMAAWPAAAQEKPNYPLRQITIVVPFPAGGAADLLARMAGEEIKGALGQPVVVENRAGASGMTGTEYVSRADPDGYTLVNAPMFNLSISDLVVRSSKLDPRKLEPVGVLSMYPTVLYARANLQANTLPELITYARANPNKLTYASQGIGQIGHLTVEELKSRASLEILHVPYRGSAPAVTDLLSGQVDLLADSLSAGIEHVRSGKLKVLAVGSKERLKALPDVASFGETIPGFYSDTWMAVAAPPGTPKAVIAKLSAAIAAGFSKPETKARVSQLQIDLLGSTPEHMAAIVTATRERWQPIIGKAKIVIE
jgi:tripartite-type tricarboxylate transporter receptor subunit TctC